MAAIDNREYFYETLEYVQTLGCCTYCGSVPGCKPQYIAYDPSIGSFWRLGGKAVYKVMCQKAMARVLTRGREIKTVFVPVTETFEEFQARLVHIE